MSQPTTAQREFGKAILFRVSQRVELMRKLSFRYTTAQERAAARVALDGVMGCVIAEYAILEFPESVPEYDALWEDS
jgi:hypothetical protein